MQLGMQKKAQATLKNWVQLDVCNIKFYRIKIGIIKSFKM